MRKIAKIMSVVMLSSVMLYPATPVSANAGEFPFGSESIRVAEETGAIFKTPNKTLQNTVKKKTTEYRGVQLQGATDKYIFKSPSKGTLTVKLNSTIGGNCTDALYVKINNGKTIKVKKNKTFTIKVKKKQKVTIKITNKFKNDFDYKTYKLTTRLK